MAGLAGKQLDHYLLVEQIGQGGMATVLRGEDTASGEAVALKVLSPTISGDRRFVKRFRREGALVSRLRHPNIIPVKDYGQDDGLIYLVMPFVEGDTLYERYRKGGIRPKQAAQWMSQIAEALHYAHENGVIHRDIKPSNIIIDGQGNANLADFGLARTVEGTSSLTGSMLMGTPAYMSPEQARGEKLDARSDQYSFGVILYQLFTGRLPYDGETPMQTAMMHLNDPIPSLRSFNEGISSALERVIQTAIAKDPNSRFPSVQALDNAFQSALRGDTLEWLQPTLALSGEEAASLRAKVERAPARERRLSPAILVVGALALLALGSMMVPQVRDALGLGGAAAGEIPTEPVEAIAPTAIASVTPPPATATGAPTAPVPVESASCPGLRIFGFTTAGNEASWDIDNGTEQDLVLEHMLDFGAPASNQAVESIRWGGETIFDATVNEGDFTWIEGVERRLGAGEIRRLSISFAWEAAATGYEMNLMFDQGCSVKGNW